MLGNLAAVQHTLERRGASLVLGPRTCLHRREPRRGMPSQVKQWRSARRRGLRGQFGLVYLHAVCGEVIRSVVAY
jgi:hypothetical protein